MELVRRVHMMREISREARSKGRKIAFVPTMGALHEGHLSLVRRARELGDLVIVSVFVNPTQFGPAEDFSTYPRDLARDTDLCVQEGVDYVFCPEAADMYPDGFRTAIDVEGLSAVLEGASRPGFFRGVATVVAKLFGVVRPHFAFFGQKDAQQALILRRMVRDLNIDVELVIAPTVRHDDGLAMSSRNEYLGAEDRKAATALFHALERARILVQEEDVREGGRVLAAMRELLEAEPRARIDYVALVGTETLESVEHIEGPCLAALAVFVGEVRLIDNMILEPGDGAGRPTSGDAR